MVEIEGYEPSSRWERTAPWIAYVTAFVIVALMGTIIFQNYQEHVFTTNAHANTVAILEEHTKTLEEVASLRQEVTTLAKKLGPELTAGQNFLIAKLNWLECVALATTPTSCGAPP